MRDLSLNTPFLLSYNSVEIITQTLIRKSVTAIYSFIHESFCFSHKLLQDRDQWRALLSTVMKLWVP
jgi:hypothetical protein